MTRLLSPKWSEIGHFPPMVLVVYLGHRIVLPGRGFGFSLNQFLGKVLSIQNEETSEKKGCTSLVARVKRNRGVTRASDPEQLRKTSSIGLTPLTVFWGLRRSCVSREHVTKRLFGRTLRLRVQHSHSREFHTSDQRATVGRGGEGGSFSIPVLIRSGE